MKRRVPRNPCIYQGYTYLLFSFPFAQSKSQTTILFKMASPTNSSAFFKTALCISDLSTPPNLKPPAHDTFFFTASTASLPFPFASANTLCACSPICLLFPSISAAISFALRLLARPPMYQYVYQRAAWVVCAPKLTTWQPKRR